MDHTKVPGSATAYRRQKQIEECLFENLLQRPYPSVSISDLCYQLGISRKSFYNYFPDKDSCFRALVSRMLRQCVLQLSSCPGQQEMIALFLSFWKEQRNLLDIIVRNNLLYLAVDQCIQFLREEDKAVLEILNTPRLQYDPYVLSVFVTANITLILHWYLNGFDTPLAEMVDKYKRIIYEPLVRVE